MSRWLVLFLLALLVVLTPVSIQAAPAGESGTNPSPDACADLFLAQNHGLVDNLCSARYEQRFQPSFSPTPLLPKPGAPLWGADVRMSNPNFNTDQNEFQIAINPTDSLNAIGTSNDGMLAGVGIYTTIDGGATWTAIDAPVGTSACCDPGVAFDSNGNAYVIVLDTSPAVSYVLKSTDKGASWTKVSQVATYDRPNIVVDNGVNSPRKGRIYITFSELQFSDRIQGVYSDNGGVSWSAPFNIGDTPPPSGYEQSSQPRVASDGTVYVGYQQYLNSGQGCNAGVQNVVARSKNGGATWAYAVLDIKQGGVCLSIQAGRGVFCINSGGSNFRSRSHPIMAVHPTNPNIVGMVYSGGDLETSYSCAGGTGFHSDILVRGSRNGGATWSRPLKVNKDPSGNDQYYPWIDVTPNGTVWVCWHDRREDANNFMHRAYCASSTDGRNWTETPVADVMSQPTTFIGDYAGLAASNTRVLPMWWDSRVKGLGDPFTDMGP